MLCSLGFCLLFLGLAGSFLSTLVGRIVGGQCPLLALNANTVCACLDHELIVLHVYNDTYNATDGGDTVAFRNRILQLLSFLLPLVFRADQEEVEDRQHRQKHNE